MFRILDLSNFGISDKGYSTCTSTQVLKISRFLRYKRTSLKRVLNVVYLLKMPVTTSRHSVILLCVAPIL
jgi:hypothetical protein